MAGVGAFNRQGPRLALHVTHEQREEIDRLAKARGTSRSTVIRDALDAYLTSSTRSAKGAAASN